jgi:hypothetical protein
VKVTRAETWHLTLATALLVMLAASALLLGGLVMALVEKLELSLAIVRMAMPGICA